MPYLEVKDQTPVSYPRSDRWGRHSQLIEMRLPNGQTEAQEDPMT